MPGLAEALGLISSMVKPCTCAYERACPCANLYMFTGRVGCTRQCGSMLALQLRGIKIAALIESEGEAGTIKLGHNKLVKIVRKNLNGSVSSAKLSSPGGFV